MMEYVALLVVITGFPFALLFSFFKRIRNGSHGESGRIDDFQQAWRFGIIIWMLVLSSLLWGGVWVIIHFARRRG